MQVTIVRKEHVLEVQFRKWKESWSRYARIELDILRKVGHLRTDPCHPDENGEPVMRLVMVADNNAEKVINVLKGYCITPEVILRRENEETDAAQDNHGH